MSQQVRSDPRWTWQSQHPGPELEAASLCGNIRMESYGGGGPGGQGTSWEALVQDGAPGTSLDLMPGGRGGRKEAQSRFGAAECSLRQTILAADLSSSSTRNWSAFPRNTVCSGPAEVLLVQTPLQSAPTLHLRRNRQRRQEVTTKQYKDNF